MIKNAPIQTSKPKISQNTRVQPTTNVSPKKNVNLKGILDIDEDEVFDLKKDKYTKSGKDRVLTKKGSTETETASQEGSDPSNKKPKPKKFSEDSEQKHKWHGSYNPEVISEIEKNFNIETYKTHHHG